MAKKHQGFRLEERVLLDIERLAEKKYNGNKTLVVERALEEGLRFLKKNDLSKI